MKRIKTFIHKDVHLKNNIWRCTKNSINKMKNLLLKQVNTKNYKKQMLIKLPILKTKIDYYQK